MAFWAEAAAWVTEHCSDDTEEQRRDGTGGQTNHMSPAITIRSMRAQVIARLRAKFGIAEQLDEDAARARDF